MLKKILAASTAGVLALSALATSAMAADATNDAYTIVIEKSVSWDNQIIEITASLTQDQMKSLLGAASDFDDASSSDDALNSYSNMLFSVWASNAAVKDKDNNTLCADFSKAIKVKSASVDVDLKAKTKKWMNIAIGATNLTTAVTDGDGNVTVTTTPAATTEITTVPVGITGQPAYNKAGASANAWLPDPTNVPNQNISSSYKESTIPTALDLSSKATTTADGLVSSPVVVHGKYDLGALTELIAMDYENSKIDFTYEVEMPTTVYNRLVELAVAAAGGSGDFWDTDTNTWNNTYILDILNSRAGQDIIGNYLGLAAQSGIVNAAGTTFTSKGGVTVKNNFKLINKTENKGSEPADLVWADWDDHDRLSLGLGVNSTPTKLKNMNNGGTITFIFNGEVPTNQFVSAEIVFRNASGASEAGVPLDSAFAFAEEGETEITVPFPADLTYAGGTTNPYKAFSFDITLNKSWSNPIGGVNPSNPTVTGNFGLRKIVVKANKEAGNNGGLVDPGNSGNSGNSGTSTPTNSGSNGGDEQNPGTGVAVAVAPVILAAAGAAVVISKKRK